MTKLTIACCALMLPIILGGCDHDRRLARLSIGFAYRCQQSKLTEEQCGRALDRIIDLPIADVHSSLEGIFREESTR